MKIVGGGLMALNSIVYCKNKELPGDQILTCIYFFLAYA